MHDERIVQSHHNPDLEEVSGSVWPDEHQHPFIEVPDKNGLVEGMKDVSIANAVLASTLGNERIALHKLTCSRRSLQGTLLAMPPLPDGRQRVGEPVDVAQGA